MQLEIEGHCRNLRSSLDRIRELDPSVYEDVLYLLALVFTVEADNRELRARQKD